MKITKSNIEKLRDSGLLSVEASRISIERLEARLQDDVSNNNTIIMELGKKVDTNSLLLALAKL